MAKPSVVVATLLAALAGAPSASAAVIVAHHDETDSRASCVVSDQCNLAGAIAAAETDDEVLVEGGGEHTLNGVITADKGIVIRGDASRPRVNTSPSNSLTLGSPDAGDPLVVERLYVVGLGSLAVGVRLAGNVIAQDLIVEGQSAGVEIRHGGNVLRDAAVFAHSAGSAAVRSVGGGPWASRVINVTAVSHGSGGAGVRGEGNASAGGGCFTEPGALEVTNVIARGVGADVEARTGSLGPTCNAGARVTVDHSNFLTEHADPGSSIEDAGGNQRLESQTAFDTIFVDAVSYLQRSTSPTRDAGRAHPQLGSHDLEGQPRSAGSAPDIGVDEYPEAPSVTTLEPADVTGTTATLRATVTPGLRDARVVFDHGPSGGYGGTTPEQVVPAGSGPVTVTSPIDGLSPGDVHHYRVRAYDFADSQPTSAEGDDVAFTTVAPAVPVIPHAPPDVEAPEALSGLTASRSIRRRVLLRRGLKVSFTLGRAASSYSVVLRGRWRGRSRRLAGTRAGNQAAGPLTLRLKARRRALRGMPKRLQTRLIVTVVPPGAAVVRQGLTVRILR